MKSLLLVLMFIGGQQAQREVLAEASITGRVTASGISQGLSNSTVLLTRVGGRLSDSLVTTTDSNGNFSLRGIPPGAYRVFADHEDFSRAEYGQRGAGRPGSPVTLSSGQQLTDINLILVPTGVITGRVTDVDGSPVSKVYVRTYIAAYAQGERTLKVAAETQTNDLGDYRIYGLPAGTYFVSAEPYKTPQVQDGNYVVPTPPRLDSFGEGQSFSALTGLLTRGGSIHPFALTGETYSQVYYPGTADQSEAKPLDLQPGAVLTGVDLQTRVLPRSAGFGVRGQFIDSTSGQVVTGVRWGFSSSINDIRSGSSASGSFEFKDVRPGRYVLSGTTGVGPAAALTGNITVEISDSDVDNLRVVLAAPITISGRVSGITSDMSGASIQLMPAIGARYSIRADGTFSLTNVREGDYRLALTGAPPNYYIQSAKIGQTSIGTTLHVDNSSPGTLTVNLSPNAGVLDGSVREINKNPATAATVVVIPDMARRRYFELYRTAATDSAGRFRIDGIVPGDYKVFAWESIEENSWQDPEILRKYEDQGMPIRVSDAMHESIELQLPSQ